MDQRKISCYFISSWDKKTKWYSHSGLSELKLVPLLVVFVEHAFWVQNIDFPSWLQIHELQSSGTLLSGSQIVFTFLINSDRTEKIDAIGASSKIGVASIKNKKNQLNHQLWSRISDKEKNIQRRSQVVKAFVDNFFYLPVTVATANKANARKRIFVVSNTVDLAGDFWVRNDFLLAIRALKYSW